MGEVYEIIETFSATLNGTPHIFRKGETVREGHEVCRLYGRSLRLIKPTYEYDSPTRKLTPPPAPAKKAVPPPAPAKKVAPPPAPAKKAALPPDAEG